METKYCKKCDTTKPVSEFSKNKSKKDGLASNCKACCKDYRDQNRDKAAEYERTWREANKERLAAQQKAYYKANKERLAAQQKAYRAANPEKVKAYNKVYNKTYYKANKERISAYRLDWQRANPEKVKAQNHRRRAAKANALGSHTAEQWQARLDYFGNKCRYCGSRDSIQCEHQIPLSRGGSNYPSNLAPACKSCNCSKGTRTHLEYLECLEKTQRSGSLIQETLPPL